MRRGIEVIRRVRELREHRATAVLAEARRDVGDRRRALDRRQAAHRAATLPARSLTPTELRAAELARTGSLEHVETAAAELEAAQHVQDDARADQVAASVARSSLDRLVERWQERVRADEDRVRRREGDELAALRWEGRR